MLSNKDVTVIVPIHEYNEEIGKFLKNALDSVPSDMSIILSTGKEILPDDLGMNSNTSILVNEDVTMLSFQNLVNAAVKHIETEWFSILEFDDEYSPKWFENFEKYQEYNQKYNFFLPINDLYEYNKEARDAGDDTRDNFAGNGNEAPWAESFSSELGVIDEQSLDDYFSFYMTGAVIRKDTFEKLGMLKNNIKLTFWYEFMLRAAHKGETFYVVPKVGYAHLLGRTGSLLNEYRDTIDKEESDFWFKTAKKESFFKEERPVLYAKASDSKKDNK